MFFRWGLGGFYGREVFSDVVTIAKIMNFFGIGKQMGRGFLWAKHARPTGDKPDAGRCIQDEKGDFLWVKYARLTGYKPDAGM